MPMSEGHIVQFKTCIRNFSARTIFLVVTLSPSSQFWITGKIHLSVCATDIYRTKNTALMLQIKNKELASSIQVIRQSDDEVGERQSTLQLNQIKSFPFDSSIVYNCGLLTLALDLANCWLFWQKPIYRPTPFLIKNRGIGLYRADLIMKTFHMRNITQKVTKD